MNVFEEVKQNVTVRQAAELYGFKPNRSGLIRCIFHNDGTPSMKVDRRYYCFGCGCTGDVINFTARLFRLKSRETALKLADDFGISYGNRARDSPKSGKSLGNEKNMDKALRAEANSKQYHPICKYLNRLEWDGTERIRYVLKRYMGADDSDMVYECLKHFMMEALLRIFKPGCKADEMLCLVGTQGAGKSTFFRFLAIKDEWFSDDLRDLGDKKIYEKLRGCWMSSGHPFSTDQSGA